ncbi:MAG: MarR family transcriptional regulator [Kiritimatiellae bacterium]|nr:MarR family transcriptional regulator [Kiritimatiellia bacterium]
MEEKIKSAWKEFINISVVYREIFTRTRRLEGSAQSDDEERLTIAQAKVANYIFEHSNEEIMLKDIAKSVKVTPGAASQMVDFLVKKGYVDRKQNEHDRRAVIITLSEKGKEILAVARGTFERIADEIFEGISCEDEQTFVRVLKLVYSRLLDKRNELDKESTI